MGTVYAHWYLVNAYLKKLARFQANNCAGKSRFSKFQFIVLILIGNEDLKLWENSRID